MRAQCPFRPKGRWKLLPRFANPCLDVTAPKFRDERTQHITPEQFRRLLAVAPDKMRAIFALLIATGMRRLEFLRCRMTYGVLLQPGFANGGPDWT